MKDLDKTPEIETIVDTETTAIIPIQSPITPAWYKEMGLNIVIAVLMAFLVVVGISVGGSITQDTTHISTECGVDNVRMKGKIPAVYDGDVKAFQKDNPELASKWLHETTGGCGQIAR